MNESERLAFESRRIEAMMSGTRLGRCTYLVEAHGVVADSSTHAACFMHAVRCAMAGFRVIELAHELDSECRLCVGSIRLQGVV